ncbi:hypothetical protein AK812_SmicGene25564 [Symbiodinium microadriaticum]|uniref:Uncharacterized protein n=1 Tax=Symbiodinium microadriaticum TaxID=2951 RepID=A0A1Q9DBZ6_SYMMI|nr:hypothetical protein AK812_SmicGene25564 [Symbiodinium microadriaticum]
MEGIGATYFEVCYEYGQGCLPWRQRVAGKGAKSNVRYRAGMMVELDNVSRSFHCPNEAASQGLPCLAAPAPTELSNAGPANSRWSAWTPSAPTP